MNLLLLSPHLPPSSLWASAVSRRTSFAVCCCSRRCLSPRDDDVIVFVVFDGDDRLAVFCNTLPTCSINQHVFGQPLAGEWRANVRHSHEVFPDGGGVIAGFERVPDIVLFTGSTELTHWRVELPDPVQVFGE